MWIHRVFSRLRAVKKSNIYRRLISSAELIDKINQASHWNDCHLRTVKNIPLQTWSYLS